MGTIRTERAVIDGISYTAKTFPATVGITLMARLGKLVPRGSIWSEFLAVTPEQLPKLFANPLLALDGLLLAARSNPPEDFADLLKDLLATTTCENVNETGVPGDLVAAFDVHFAGRYDHLWKVVVWAARVSFTGSWHAPRSSVQEQTPVAA